MLALHQTSFSALNVRRLVDWQTERPPRVRGLPVWRSLLAHLTFITSLFPSNYVEKLQDTAAQGPREVPPLPAGTGKKEYKPFKAAFHGSDASPATTNSVGLQQDPGQDAKK